MPQDRPSASAPQGLPVTEADISIETPDGSCDAVLIHPTTGTHPGILFWPDGLGLRQVFRDMGKRLAAAGYSVLVPNHFYRSARPPIFSPTFSFENPADIAKLKSFLVSLTPAAIEEDAVACTAFLDAQASVDMGRPIGTLGYCMTGQYTLRTAATIPHRIGAAASFHGGSLVTDQPTSPHLLAAKIKARCYIGIAASDDQKQPDAKDKLKGAFDGARLPAEVEVYAGTLHGWCIADMPPQGGMQTYHHEQAERAWTKLLSLYKAALI